MMTSRTTLPPRGRDYRLDLLRGFANWAIYLDHIPNNAVNWVTQRNYGFSDAADLFVFISGYTASFVYARIMLQRGSCVGVSHAVGHVMLVKISGCKSQCPQGRRADRRRSLPLLTQAGRQAQIRLPCADLADDKRHGAVSR